MMLSGFSHRYSQLGDVASCTDTKIRKVSRHPSRNCTPNSIVSNHRVILRRLMSYQLMISVAVSRYTPVAAGVRGHGVASSCTPSSGPSTSTDVPFITGTLSPCGFIKYAPSSSCSSLTGANVRSLAVMSRSIPAPSARSMPN